MKKIFCFLTVLIILCMTVCSCGHRSYDNYDYNDNNDNGGYNDYNGDGEYKFSDYLKDQAPDLYNDIKDRYDSLK